MSAPVVAICTTTDGRNECLEKMIDRVIEHVPPCTLWLLCDDSGESTAAPFYDRFSTVLEHPERQGLAAAVDDLWRAAVMSGADYVLHWEDDFVPADDVDLDGMLGLLALRPWLNQVALKRQPALPHVNPAEHAAGGYIEANPDAYAENYLPDYGGPGPRHAPWRWVEHSQFFTLNPSLIPRRVFEQGWPAGADEGTFYRDVLVGKLETPTCAIWGGKFDAPRVLHVGDDRTAGWRL